MAVMVVRLVFILTNVSQHSIEDEESEGNKTEKKANREPFLSFNISGVGGDDGVEHKVRGPRHHRAPLASKPPSSQVLPTTIGTKCVECASEEQ